MRKPDYIYKYIYRNGFAFLVGFHPARSTIDDIVPSPSGQLWRKTNRIVKRSYRDGENFPGSLSRNRIYVCPFISLGVGGAYGEMASQPWLYWARSPTVICRTWGRSQSGQLDFIFGTSDREFEDNPFHGTVEIVTCTILFSEEPSIKLCCALRRWGAIVVRGGFGKLWILNSIPTNAKYLSCIIISSSGPELSTLSWH